MTEWRRFVFDSSTVISAALTPGGKPRAALVQAGLHGELLTSLATFAELTSRLRRPKFNRYLDPEARADFLNWLEELMLFVEVTTTVADCRDPDDDKFLELALDGEADVLISSDSDLLVLHPYRGISIMKPVPFLEALKAP